MGFIFSIIILPLFLIAMVVYTIPFILFWGFFGGLAILCFGGAVILIVTYIILLRKGIFLKYEESEVKWQKSLTKFGKGLMIAGAIFFSVLGALDLIFAGQLAEYLQLLRGFVIE